MRQILHDMPNINGDTNIPLFDTIPFHDPVCHTTNVKDHLSDLDCHHSEIIDVIKHKPHTTCRIEMPYPVGKVFELSEEKAPRIFRIHNYPERLKNAACLSVYHQYTTLEIHESIAYNLPLKPIFNLASLKTSILFFKAPLVVPTSEDKPSPDELKLIPDPNRIKSFEITPIEYQKQTQFVLPSYWNWMNKDNITYPLNQGQCGNCWAIAVATCLSDVFVVSKKTSLNPELSHKYIFNCYPQDQCDGGDPIVAMTNLLVSGVSDKSCYTTDKTDCKCDVPSSLYYPSDLKLICIPPKKENFSEAETHIFTTHLNELYGSNVHLDLSSAPDESIQHLIKHHIYTHGPVLGGFHVFKNFLKGDFRETNDIYIETYAYQGVQGIQYKDIEKDWVGSHAVVITGWGTDIVKGNNVTYWVARNSWGDTWGNRGTFKIAMYGNTPYQNKVSQFEYPSMVTLEPAHVGVALTGGILLVKAGDIKPHSVPNIHAKSFLDTSQHRWIYGIIIICIVVLFITYIFIKKNKQ